MKTPNPKLRTPRNSQPSRALTLPSPFPLPSLSLPLGEGQGEGLKLSAPASNLMQTNLQIKPGAETPITAVSIKVFGVGTAGLKVIEPLIRSPDLSGDVAFVALNTDAQSLAASSALEKVHLERNLLRGLPTSREEVPERRRPDDEQFPKLKAACEGADVIFIVAGLGGGTGTRLSPALAQAAQAAGALVLGFVTLPFECEGSRRLHLAQRGLEELKTAADGVICLPNQKVLRLIDENTSVLETFKMTNELLADGVRGVWRLLRHSGLIDIHFAELGAVLRARHAESLFAVAEGMGPARSREVVEKLLAHPMLDGGQVLGESDRVLVSLMGGPDLTMAEVNRVMEQINRHCEHAQVLLGAAIDESFRDRLAVTLVAGRREPDRPSPSPSPIGWEREGRGEPRSGPEELDAQLLNGSATARPGSRFVPPPPALPPEQMQQLLARQAPTRSHARKRPAKLRQTQLPLEIVSKGRFDKSEPTIYKGEDLDVPTYVRRGVALN